MISQIAKVGSVLYGVLLLCSYINLKVYYLKFYIDISSYLSVADILLLFLRSVFPLFSLLIFILIYLTFDFLFFFIRFSILKGQKVPIDDYLRTRSDDLSFNFWAFLVTLIIFNRVYSLVIEIDYETFLILGYPLIIFISYKVIKKAGILKKELGLSLGEKDIIQILLISMLLVLSAYHGMTESIFTQRKGSDYRFEFNYQGRNINSDSTNIFLGSTSKFIFLFNKESHTSSIYKLEDLKDLRSGKRIETPSRHGIKKGEN